MSPRHVNVADFLQHDPCIATFAKSMTSNIVQSRAVTVYLPFKCELPSRLLPTGDNGNFRRRIIFIALALQPPICLLHHSPPLIAIIPTSNPVGCYV